MLSSPLSRALQTAIVSLHSHPATKAGGITCVASAREIKGTTGFDCLGVAIGPSDNSVTHTTPILPRICSRTLMDCFVPDMKGGTKQSTSDLLMR